MQKKLIALAVAGLVAAPVAMAQSNVTIYGVADAAFVHGKAGDRKFSGINSGVWAGSRIGFRGTEDLGNGLKAVFTLEYGIDIDQNSGLGNGTPNARQQFVGLDGGFGFVGLGRQYAPGFWSLRYDAFGGVPFAPLGLLTQRAGSTISPSSNARWDNAVAYRSPNMNGLTFSAIHSFSENQTKDPVLGNRSRGSKSGIGADYANGPIGVGLVYQRTEGGSASDAKEWMLGGSYDFGAVKLSGTYSRLKDVRDGDTDKIWQLGVAVPVSDAGNVRLAYGRFSADADDRDAKMWTLGYTHNLSKRTMLYTAYTRVNNSSDQNFSFATTASTTAGTPPVTTRHNVGKNSNAFLMGVSHSF